MQRALATIILTTVFVIFIDLGASGLLNWATKNKKLTSLVSYFEYGRSVPGKLSLWRKNPELPRNLYEVAWRPSLIKGSNESFARETDLDPPVIRSYGMSFVNNILIEAKSLDESLTLDLHAGPGAPPNFTYSIFIDDRESRRSGDIAILGILSSSVHAMAAMSNMTWGFEQPAPFTYPIFVPEGEQLIRVNPVVESKTDRDRLWEDQSFKNKWIEQLTNEDLFYGPTAFGYNWTDISPFARLVRRSLATSHIKKIKHKIINDKDYDYENALVLIVENFANVSRADEQVPVVFLIQSRDQSDPDLLSILEATLTEHKIPYLATAQYADPRNPSFFLGDGHYKKYIDIRFAEKFLEKLKTLSSNN